MNDKGQDKLKSEHDQEHEAWLVSVLFEGNDGTAEKAAVKETAQEVEGHNDDELREKALRERLADCDGCLEYAARLLDELPLIAAANRKDALVQQKVLERLESALLSDEVITAAANESAKETSSSKQQALANQGAPSDPPPASRRGPTKPPRRARWHVRAAGAAVSLGAVAAAAFLFLATPPESNTKDLHLDKPVELVVKQIKGPLSDVQLRIAVEARLEELNACAPTRQTKVNVTLDVGGEGVLRRPVEVSGADSTLEKCIQEALRPSAFGLASAPSLVVIELLMRAPPPLSSTPSTLPSTEK